MPFSLLPEGSQRRTELTEFFILRETLFSRCLCGEKNAIGAQRYRRFRGGERKFFEYRRFSPIKSPRQSLASRVPSPESSSPESRVRVPSPRFLQQPLQQIRIKGFLQHPAHSRQGLGTLDVVTVNAAREHVYLKTRGLFRKLVE
jgi:hypothetical protein